MTSRDRYVDFLRAWAIVLVVFGHWLITALEHGPEGGVWAPELLAELPWTQGLTLLFQIMPLFFLAGGHAAAGSWERARSAGGTAAGWVGRRALRLLLPAGVYSGLVLLAVGISAGAGVDPDTLSMVGWAMAMQLWFLPVYLLLSALTPALHTAHRRWGPGVPVVMGAVAVGVDVAVVAGGVSSVGVLDYVLVWGVAYQLGFCRRDGLLDGPAVPWVLAVSGGAAFALLVALGPYPVSLIRVTGQETGNTDPPSVAMLAWVVAQVGVCQLVAPAVRRLLDRERVRRVVRPVGGASMTLYLWHMLPVLVLAAAFYLTGLAPQPTLGSPGWWGLRVPWLLLLAAVLAGVVAALRPVERRLGVVYDRTRPEPGLRRGAWAVWLGLAVSALALSRFAVHGFAPDGRFPVLPALGLAAGTALVLLPGLRRGSLDEPAQRAWSTPV
ncbi:hypothetical protein SLINC_5717 [Streptomyces lincolnensis]|uniref:Uncharacterized protein n=1 Tax=Streptomyces lincolnensis TaxID=1915 RepID=A0A1B1MH73_STRLN|nr:hypothetical protein SLINC_5717 [Streptomyces lincolnensis]AXG53854.1 hypothetical protein SLCG_2699 [Streptomyces lincolnensis]